MKKQLDNKYLYIGIMLFLVIAASTVVLVGLMNLGTVTYAVRTFFRAISPVFYGLAFAFLLNPVMIRFERLFLPVFNKIKRIQKSEKFPPRRTARMTAIAFTVILALLVIYALFDMIIPQLGASILTIASNLSTYFNNLQTWLTGLFEDSPQIAELFDSMSEKIYAYVANWLSNDFLPIFSSVTTSVMSVFNAVFCIIIGLIISVYILASKDTFQSGSKKAVYAIFKVEKANEIMEVVRYANKVFGRFIIGQLTDSLIVGLICFAVMSILGLPFPLLISIVVGATNIIPFFGPFLGAIPSTIIILVVNPMQALYFVIFILILQQIDGNIICPHIVGDATGVAGFWVVVSILVFNALFGVVGMIIAVPTFAVISLLVSRKVESALKKKGMDSSADFKDVDRVDPETLSFVPNDDQMADKNAENND